MPPPDTPLPRPPVREPPDDPAGCLPELDDLEARYSAATLDLWDARSRYLRQFERTGGVPDGAMRDAWSAYQAARQRCTQLMLSIEAIEAMTEAPASVRTRAGFTAPPSGHHARR